MKFTFSWLKEHIDTYATTEEILASLNTIGIEAESIENQHDSLSKFIIAEITSIRQHPILPYLKVCNIDAGGEKNIEVVCGGANARTGLKTVFAPPGTKMPRGHTINIASIHGVKSHGMLCSASELQLTKDMEIYTQEQDSIIELADDAQIGASYIGKPDEPIFKVTITPNRSDCASVRGIARDLVASGIGLLKQEDPPYTPPTPYRQSPVDVYIDIPKSNPAYIAISIRCIAGIKNRPSPYWLQSRLLNAGLQPISAVVDIANYLTLDQGQPLHVFDADMLSGNLCLRVAKHREELVALNGTVYKLDNSDLVLADNNGAISIAGIVGGLNSACRAETTNILIESAYLDSVTIARSRQKLNISSEAAYRFERGVDPDRIQASLDHATKLILDVCGGIPCREVTDKWKLPVRDIIAFPISEVSRISGLELSCNEITKILESLGCSVVDTKKSILQILPPSWRGDLTGKNDLVEEIARIHGICKISPVPLPIYTTETGLTTAPQLKQNIRNLTTRILATRGMMEVITWSFISESHAKAFNDGNSPLSLLNPISQQLSHMRTNLLTGLLSTIMLNGFRGVADLSLFEIGEIFKGRNSTDQELVAAGVRRGTGVVKCRGRDWRNSIQPVTCAEAKSDALAILDGLGFCIDNMKCKRNAPKWYHPGRSGVIEFNSRGVLASFGELHPDILGAFELSYPTVAFEINLGLVQTYLGEQTKQSKNKLNTSNLLDISRDYAFIVNENVEAEQILEAIYNVDTNIISQVNVFDVFRSPTIGKGKKSVAVNVLISPKNKTPTDTELALLSTKIVNATERATGAILRQ